MFRYLKLYAYFIRFSFSKALEFRFDFTFRIFMDLLYYGVNIFFYMVIYDHTNLLGGWTREQALVFVGAFIFIDALNMTLFSNNLWWFPYYVNRGDLDYYLIRPVSSLFFLSLREFAVNSLVNLIAAVFILSWAIGNLPQTVTTFQVSWFIILLFLGTFLHYSVRILTILPVFWMHAQRGMEGLFWTMSRFMERPDRIFSGPVRAILLSVLPFSVMASFPARLFLEGFDWAIFFHMVGLCCFFFSAVLLVWNLALRAYSSASS